MILDFFYKTDSQTGRIIEESGGLRKYLIPIIRNNKISDILSAFSIVLFEKFYKEKLLPKKNKYNVNETSGDNLKNILWEFGHNLTIGDFYTSSDEYLRRQARTITKRIVNKNTRTSYIYLYYIYGFKYSYTYRGNVISSSNRILDIKEGTDNISIGATVYGEGVEEDTFVIAKGTNFVDLSKNINLRFNAIGYGVPFSFYNEDIDSLISASSPIDSLETLKGKTIAELVDIRDYFLDTELKDTVLINVDQILADIPSYQNLSFYSSLDSPRFIEKSGIKYLTYDFLSLDENEPIYLAKPDGLFVTIPKANLFTWYLDYSDVGEATTRHLILNYIMGSVETDTDFITKQSCEAFYRDVLQNKRLIEVPHFEPKLNLTVPVGVVPPNPLNIFKFANLYTYTNSLNETRTGGRLNDVATMVNVCFTDNLLDITHIQFGKGRRNLNEITLQQMDYILNDGINNISVSQVFENEDLSFNSIVVDPLNKYRFLNPLKFPKFREIIQSLNLPSLSPSELEINNSGVLGADAPYYQLSKENRWSFPIQYFKIEKLSSTQFILRNYLFPYFKWSGFSEISFLRKNSDGSYTTILYCTFPTVNYSNNMLSSIYINLSLVYNFEEVATKLSFTFVASDWVQEPNSDFYYLEIPYENKSYDDYLGYSFEYRKPSENSSTNTNYYFFQNIGYNPFYYIYKRGEYDSQLQAFTYEKVDVELLTMNSVSGLTKIKINYTELSPFAGKLILI